MLLRTLGGLALEGSTLTRPKPLLVLAYLALEGPTPRRRLAELFFGDAADPRDSLSTALRYLRREGAIEDHAGDVVSAVVVADAVELLRAYDAFRYTAVWSSYDGPFVDGADAGLAVEAEEWALVTREAIADRVRAAGLHLARVAVRAGRHDEARAVLTRCLSLAGASELEADELEIAIMLAEQVDLPERARLRALAAGYGLDLTSAAGLPSATFAATSLHRSTRFVGRADDLWRVESLLGAPETRLVTLFGLGGIGKTRLAVRVTERLAAMPEVPFRDGIVTVALEHVAHEDDVRGAIGEALSLPSQATRDLTTLATAIGSASLLLVLDNVEQVVGAAMLVSGLLSRCAHLRMLVTSRERLGLDEEHAVALAGLSLERRGDAPSEAATLFADRAARVGASDTSETDPDVIEAICRNVEGHPLAIELAAGMTRVLGVQAILEQVSAGLDVFEGGPIDAPERHREVRAAMQPTWRALTQGERDAITRLATFHGSFALDAATDVADVRLHHLVRLVDAALVRSRGGGRGRFALHPLVRAFAREQADTASQHAAAARHQVFFQRWLESARHRVAEEGDEVLDRMQLELADLVQAIRYAFDDGHVDTGVAMTRVIAVDADFLLARSPSRELRRWVEYAARAAETNGDLGSAEALLTKLANARRVVDRDLRGAVGLYERAARLAEASGSGPRTAMLYAILGAHTFDLGEGSAASYLEKAQAIARRARDDLSTCEVLQRVAYVEARRGAWEQARVTGVEAVRTAERLVADPSAAPERAASLLYFSLCNLGTCEDELGRIEDSLARRFRALEIARGRGQKRWMGAVHQDIAQALHALGRRDAALEHARSALTAYREIEAEDGCAAVLEDARAWGFELEPRDEPAQRTDAGAPRSGAEEASR